MDVTILALLEPEVIISIQEVRAREDIQIGRVNKKLACCIVCFTLYVTLIYKLKPVDGEFSKCEAGYLVQGRLRVM